MPLCPNVTQTFRDPSTALSHSCGYVCYKDDPYGSPLDCSELCKDFYDCLVKIYEGKKTTTETYEATDAHSEIDRTVLIVLSVSAVVVLVITLVLILLSVRSKIKRRQREQSLEPDTSLLALTDPDLSMNEVPSLMQQQQSVGHLDRSLASDDRQISLITSEHEHVGLMDPLELAASLHRQNLPSSTIPNKGTSPAQHHRQHVSDTKHHIQHVSDTISHGSHLTGSVRHGSHLTGSVRPVPSTASVHHPSVHKTGRGLESRSIRSGLSSPNSPRVETTSQSSQGSVPSALVTNTPSSVGSGYGPKKVRLADSSFGIPVNIRYQPEGGPASPRVSMATQTNLDYEMCTQTDINPGLSLTSDVSCQTGTEDNIHEHLSFPVQESEAFLSPTGPDTVGSNHMGSGPIRSDPQIRSDPIGPGLDYPYLDPSLVTVPKFV